MKLREESIEKVVRIILNSKYLVAFTGAGISTESGLPDYRGPKGIWTLREKGLKPKLPKKPVTEIEPNLGHIALFELYNLGILKYLISQNVDNLHLKSGIPPKILSELHGNSSLMKCMSCDKRFSKVEIGWNDQIHGNGYRTQKQLLTQPKCPQCNGRIISSVINFNDPMPEKEMQEAKIHSKKCDVMLALGSTLSVYPAANFPIMAKNFGTELIIINEGKTQLDHLADIRIEAKIGEILPFIVDRIKSYDLDDYVEES